MENELIETGKIINTHGLRGEIKIEAWANSPEDLLDYSRFFIENREYRVLRSRIQKGFFYAQLEGIDTIEAAETYKEKVISVSRDDIDLEDGELLLSDLVGMRAVDEDGTELGKVSDILTPPGGDVIVITGSREILIPVRDEFIIDIDEQDGTIVFRLIEGM